MSHVCRSWRNLLIARSSLWVRLDCANTDKTRVYIERSKSLPLELSLCKYGYAAYVVDAIPLVIPHVSRLECLSIIGCEALKILTPHLSHPIPLLRKLTITANSDCRPTPVFDTTLFNGDLSSLCSLSLVGVINIYRGRICPNSPHSCFTRPAPSKTRSRSHNSSISWRVPATSGISLSVIS